MAIPVGLLVCADVIWTLLFPARVSSYRLGSDVGRTYTGHAGALVFLFMVYVRHLGSVRRRLWYSLSALIPQPIVFGLCEVRSKSLCAVSRPLTFRLTKGGNVLRVTSEFIWVRSAARWLRDRRG